MDCLQTEIARTKSQIERTQQQLDGMVNDFSVPLWKPVQANARLKDLVAYLRGLEYQTDYADIETTVTVSSSSEAACKECNSGPGSSSTLGDRVDHYLKHGYKLLYVGQETRRDHNGKPWDTLVAVLGKK
jgi:hypothetical protein